MKIPLVILCLMLAGCGGSIDHTVDQRPISDGSSASAATSPPNPTDTDDPLLVVCSTTSFEFVYKGGDLLTELSIFLHQRDQVIAVNSIFISALDGSDVIKIDPSVSSDTTVSMTFPVNTKLVFQGQTCTK